MSNSVVYSGFSGRKSAKSPERSTFSQTCSLLSQYLKEKGSFGDLTLGMTCNNTNIEPNGSPETSCQSATTMHTMNLFPTRENNMTPQNPTFMNLLSQQAAFRRHLSEEFQTLVNSSAPKSVGKAPKAAQMTIFYAGQVIVFDDFPAEKAKEIMSFASKGISQSHNNCACTYSQCQPSFPPNLFRTSADANSIQERPQAPPGPVVSDLPIARKASLHRFLEKRKDRIAAKAPYQTSNPMGGHNKQAEPMTWLGLGASPQI